MPTVLVTEGSDAKPLDWLRQHATVLETAREDPAFDQHLATADGMVVRTYTKVNAALLAKAPNLKVVCRGGVGRENIDDAAYDPKEFKRIRNTVRGRQLNELTIGILGMGRVGRRVGHIAAHGFGMRVIYNDITPSASP